MMPQKLGQVIERVNIAKLAGVAHLRNWASDNPGETPRTASQVRLDFVQHSLAAVLDLCSGSESYEAGQRARADGHNLVKTRL